MLKSFLNDPFVHLVATSALSAAAAAIAWVATNFFAEPLLTFYRRRRAILESMIYCANVGSGSRDDVYLAAYNELRRHSAALSATWQTSPTAIRVWLRYRGFDLPAAASAILGFSNSLTTQDGSKALFRPKILSALRYPDVGI
jgi:hypothetical protein